MFEDSESESEAEAPAPVKPAPRKRSRAPPPDDDSDSDAEDRKRPVGPGFRRDEWRADALARSGAGDIGGAGSFVDRMAASFNAPRVVGAPDDEDAAPRRAAPPPAVALDPGERQRRQDARGAAAGEPRVGPRRPRGLRPAVDARPRDGDLRGPVLPPIHVPRDAVKDPLGERQGVLTIIRLVTSGAHKGRSQ